MIFFLFKLWCNTTDYPLSRILHQG